MIFETREFDDKAREMLSDTFGDAGKAADFIKGECSVFRVTENDGEELGWLVCHNSVDGYLFIDCYQGKDVLRVAEVMKEAAQINGQRGVRYYTQRPGMTKILKPVGAKIRGYILEY